MLHALHLSPAYLLVILRTREHAVFVTSPLIRSLPVSSSAAHRGLDRLSRGNPARSVRLKPRGRFPHDVAGLFVLSETEEDGGAQFFIARPLGKFDFANEHGI